MTKGQFNLTLTYLVLKMKLFNFEKILQVDCVPFEMK